MLRDEIEQLVGRINGDFGRIGRPAIHYLHQSIPREELAALYRAADVMLVTPLRDGMNLVAKEYVAAAYDDGGALVLSEFAGAADELRQAFLVNPHDINGHEGHDRRRAATPSPRERTRGCGRCASTGRARREPLGVQLPHRVEPHQADASQAHAAGQPQLTSILGP